MRLTQVEVIKMCLRFYAIKLLSLFSVVTAISLSAAERNDREDMAMQAVANEGYAHELLLPRLYRHLGLLCNRDNQGTVIAENADKGSIALTPDGHYCAFILDNDPCSIKIYDTRTYKQISSLKKGATCLSFSPDGQVLFSGGTDGNIYVWNFITGDLIRTYTFPEIDAHSETGPRFFRFSPDCQTVLLAYKSEGLCWTLNSNDVIKDKDFGYHLMMPGAFASQGQFVFRMFCSYGQRIWSDAVKKGEQKICLYDLVNKHEIISFPIFPDSVAGLAYGNNMIAVRYNDFPHCRVDIWDTQTGQLMKTLPIGEEARPTRLFFSPDGRFLVVAYNHFQRNGNGRAIDYESGVKVFDITTGRLIQELPYWSKYPDERYSIAADRFGQIATIGFDGRVRLFNNIPENIHRAIRALSLNQLGVLMEIVPPLAQGHVIHLTPNSRSWNLVNQMAPEIRMLVEPCLH